MNNIDILIGIPVFGIIITMLICILSWDIDFSNNNEDMKLELELQEKKKIEQEQNMRDNSPREHETIVMPNKGHIDINNIRNSDIRIESILEDLSKFINLVMVNELYSIELTGGLHIGKDDKLKEAVNLITVKILDSMGDNFRAKFYLFMNENLLVETIHSNVSRQVIAHISKTQGNLRQ